MRRLPRATWITIVVTGLLTVLGSVVGNRVPALTWLSPKVALVLFVLISLFLILLSLWQAGQKAASEPSAADARENRQIMLNRVQSTWITGFLENPLYHSYEEQLLLLSLRERVGSRFDLVLSNPLEPAQTVPPGKTLAQVFDQAGGELLILGEPGAGKTTLLLELARDLLKRAKDNEAAPIPVVLMLSSWATRKLPLERWIVEELKTKYSIPSWIGKEWVEANQLLLLLDGLDEVTPDALSACIEAINEYYHQAHRSLVVCSRTKEFLGQPGRLALNTAVTVQPLLSEQVDAYLDDLAAKGEDVKGLKQILHRSAALRALATIPLILTVLILAYHGKPVKELLELVKTTPTDQPHLLFQNYVERMLQRKGTRIHALAQQTKHWLAWLARQMTAHYQSELYLEQFQPDWLPEGQRAFYQWSIGLVVLVYMLVAGLLGGLVVGLVAGQGVGLVVLVYGLFIGLGAWLSVGLLVVLLFGQDTKIEPTEALTWSWKGLVSVLVYGLVMGLLVVLPGGLLVGLDVGLSLRVGLGVGLFSLLVFGLGVGLFPVFSGKQLTERSMLSPNEGIHRSLKHGLLLGLGVGLFLGLGVGLTVGLPGGLLFGLGVGLFVGLLGGLLGGLSYGLGAAVQHYTLRFLLWQARCTPAPWRHVAFLDDAVEQLLLRKVGGGYIFRHHLLQDYFASLDVVPPYDPSVRAEAYSVLQNAPNGDPSL